MDRDAEPLGQWSSDYGRSDGKQIYKGAKRMKRGGWWWVDKRDNDESVEFPSSVNEGPDRPTGSSNYSKGLRRGGSDWKYFFS